MIIVSTYLVGLFELLITIGLFSRYFLSQSEKLNLRGLFCRSNQYDNFKELF